MADSEKDALGTLTAIAVPFAFAAATQPLNS